MFNDYKRKPLRHVEDTITFKAHRMACAWMWPEDEDVNSRTDTEKLHAKLLRTMLAAGLRRIEEEGGNPMTVSLVSEVLPNANVMGLIYKRVSTEIPDEAISRTVGSLVMEQIYGPRDRLAPHLANAEDCLNAYAYAQALEARMRVEISEGKNPLSKTARQLGFELTDLRADVVAARLEREEREKLEAQTDAFAAGTPACGSDVSAGGMPTVEVREVTGLPHEVFDNDRSLADAALLG